MRGYKPWKTLAGRGPRDEAQTSIAPDDASGVLMSQIDHGPYAVLKRPIWFEAVQDLFVRNDARRVLADSYIKPQPGDRVLDIGCGTGSMLPYLGDIVYTGVDPEPRYIDAARRRYAACGTFVQSGARELAERYENAFDIAIAIGVLHHLDDAEAASLFATARKALKPGGRFVTSDPVRLSPQHPVARFLIYLDRGRSVRSQQGYFALAEPNFRHIRTELRHDFMRLPYDHCVIVCEKDRD